MVSSRTLKEFAAFTVFLGAIHYAYYSIQNNPNLVNPRERTELFYVKWLKNNVPGLENIGLKEPNPKDKQH